jgi:hypothetical protein
MKDNLRDSTYEACETIDAALFSGDEFIMSPEARESLRNYIERWNLKLDDMDATDADDEDVDEDGR